ncbi:GTPase IMAP family member 8-like protein [Labeo rohita]|uniref:GTPase IMAP family member 8-like protein n=1 Tax=Labeo rohita TaxID=84645 RepID=A0A498NVF9_LABRO|nr:GTPase IMAP family member 8-like protein [Labeo rohita]
MNKLLPQEEMSKVCQKREGTIHGRQISVLELPALTRLSEEEMMQETYRCLFLCDPGVHHFILVTPVSPLTNEDKAEMEKIKRIFNSNEHFMVLFITELTVNQSVIDFVESTESQGVVSLYGSWYDVIGLKDQRNSRQISDLFDYIESMKTEPYSLQTYIRAPERRVRRELEEKLRVRDNEIKELQKKIKTLGSDRVYSPVYQLREFPSFWVMIWLVTKLYQTFKLLKCLCLFLLHLCICGADKQRINIRNRTQTQ